MTAAPHAHVELVVYEGQNHGFFNFKRDGGKMFIQTTRDMVTFLSELGYLD